MSGKIDSRKELSFKQEMIIICSLMGIFCMGFALIAEFCC